MKASNRPPDGNEGERAAPLDDIGTSLLSELDLEALLDTVVNRARELTGAEYAAVGVLDRGGKELERFIYDGIDDDVRRDIGDLPRGRGILGELIRHPEPLRLHDVDAHPRAYGFPPGHPPMHSFLGLPIRIRGEVYGNLYMTEKEGGEDFDDDDEYAAKTLALWAGIAIENARLYTSLAEREVEVENALRRAEASLDIAHTVGGETDVERVLDLIVKRARALVEARTVLVLLRTGDRIRVAAHAGHGRPESEDLTIPADDAVFQRAVEERVAQHLARGSPASKARLRERLGAEAALVVPLLFRGRSVGALVALDREAGGGEFDGEDLRMLKSFAASAATAVATAQTVESERLQQRMDISEKERSRWARELHDETLQSLAAIRIELASALQDEDSDPETSWARVAGAAVGHLEEQIEELNRLINDLRPSSLEHLGLVGALEALAQESGARGGFEVDAAIALDGKLSEEYERVVYRVAQEALNNVVKHAAARRATLEASSGDREVRVVVKDDGEGFEMDAVTAGRGLSGMRERVALLGGELEVLAEPEQGTRIVATIPLS
jgi:signal transduction histidine kinase